MITGGTSGIGRGIAEKILAESAKTDRIFVTYGHDEKKALSFQESLPEEKKISGDFDKGRYVFL